MKTVEDNTRPANLADDVPVGIGRFAGLYCRKALSIPMSYTPRRARALRTSASGNGTVPDVALVNSSRSSHGSVWNRRASNRICPGTSRKQNGLDARRPNYERRHRESHPSAAVQPMVDDVDNKPPRFEALESMRCIDNSRVRFAFFRRTLSEAAHWSLSWAVLPT